MFELIMNMLICFLVFDAMHIMAKLSKMDKDIKEIKKMVEDLRISQVVKDSTEKN